VWLGVVWLPDQLRAPVGPVVGSCPALFSAVTEECTLDSDPVLSSRPSAARLKYLYDLMRENQVCELSRWDCGMVTGTF